MENLHSHCLSCVSRRCMVKPEPSTSCDLTACPLVCGAVYHLCKTDEHRLLCPIERVPCLNHSIGCPFTLARGKMAEHLEVCPAGVVCCTMEWNRWPVNDEDYRSYERLSRDADQEEQLDMALALQDQRTMLASLKLFSLSPTDCPDRKSQQSESLNVDPNVSVPGIPLEEGMDEDVRGNQLEMCCSNDKIRNGINGSNTENFGEFYQSTIETTKSLSAALNVFIQINTSDKGDNAGTMESELNKDVSNCEKIANGVSGLNEELQPHEHQTLMELGKNVVCALGVLGDAVKNSESSSKGEIHRPERVEPEDVEMKDIVSERKFESGGFEDGHSDVTKEHTGPEASLVCLCPLEQGHSENSTFSLCCNRNENSGSIAESPARNMELVGADDRCANPDSPREFIGPLVPHRPDVRRDVANVVMQEASEFEAPLLQSPVHAQALFVPPNIVPSFDFEDKVFERTLQNLQLLRNFMPLAFNSRRGYFTVGLPHRNPHCKMEDKAVDTSDLEQEPQEDPLGLGEIDFTAAALLFCLEESPRARRISDTVYAFGGTRVDFGTQTFSFPAAILATGTMVGEVASASACDRAAPRLSQPSPFCTLRLDLTLEQLVPRPSWAPREGSMFTFECGQLFRREEFLSHFRNVHGDIHSGLNGWMEHRCPLAYYGCTYSQRRLCPSQHGSKIIHNRHLRSFGVQYVTSPAVEPGCDRISSLPFEILQHVARFLDGFSLCQLSMVSRTMRDVCASLLQTRGMVVVQWEKRQYPDGRRSWQIKDKVWRFSTAFSPVTQWEFADIYSMADHLKRCPYNEVHRQVEAVPLPCMCTTRELTRDGRSLRSVLKPVL